MSEWDGLVRSIAKLVNDRVESAMRKVPRQRNARYFGKDGEGVEWVVVEGEEHPRPARSSSCEASLDDVVRVTIADGALTIDSNVSNPGAGVRSVAAVDEKATVAKETAVKAVDYAGQASTAAANASGQAVIAQQQAERATASADSAAVAASEARDHADDASRAAKEANDSAAEAKADAASAKKSAIDAASDAADARTQATRATTYANASLDQFGIVQDVVGVLDYAVQNGSFEPTSDTEVQDGKVYFTFDPQSGDYSPVVVPDASQLTSYYELSVDDAMSDYILAHLAVTSRGLWVLPHGTAYQASTDTSVVSGTAYYARYGSGTTQDPYRYRKATPDGTEDPSNEGWFVTAPQYGDGYKTLLANDGMYVYDGSGLQVAKYGSTAELGIPGYSQFKMNSGSLQAYDANGDLYFQVSASGIQFGSSLASTVATTSDIPTAVSELANDSGYATTGQVATAKSGAVSEAASDATTKANAAAKTATDYVEPVGTTGAYLHPSGSTANRVLVDGNGMEVFKDGTSVAFYGDTARVGKTAGPRTVIQSNGVDLYGASDGSAHLAHFGYGGGTNSSGGTSATPYYTLGTRASGSAVGNYSTVEGYGNTASGYASHASGQYAVASGEFSHAEGQTTTASGNHSHAEGECTTASGNFSHAEGYDTTASGECSHAEGECTTASGIYSHAEGYATTASKLYSHAQNYRTLASSAYQTAIGRYNKSDGSSVYAFIIGNGTSDNDRSNAMGVCWDGACDVGNRQSVIYDNRAYPLYIWTSNMVSPASYTGTYPVSPCFVYYVPDNGLYYCTN